MNTPIIGVLDRHRGWTTRRARIVAAVLLTVATTTGCAEVHRLRAIQTNEWDAVSSAIGPLMLRLGYFGNPKPKCSISTTVNDVRANFLMLVPGTAEECLRLHVTTGAITALPARELRAILAHELAHVHLGHQPTWHTRADIAVGTELGLRWGMRFSRATFNADQEAAADRFAGLLLMTVGDLPITNDCQALSELLARVAEDPDGWRKWTDRHPVGNGRGEHARRVCEGVTGG